MEVHERVFYVAVFFFFLFSSRGWNAGRKSVRDQTLRTVDLSEPPHTGTQRRSNLQLVSVAAG